MALNVWLLWPWDNAKERNSGAVTPRTSCHVINRSCSSDSQIAGILCFIATRMACLDQRLELIARNSDALSTCLAFPYDINYRMLAGLINANYTSTPIASRISDRRSEKLMNVMYTWSWHVMSHDSGPLWSSGSISRSVTQPQKQTTASLSIFFVYL